MMDMILNLIFIVFGVFIFLMVITFLRIENEDEKLNE
jgi:hypothetical protein